VMINSDKVTFDVGWIPATEITQKMKAGVKLTELEAKKVIELIKNAIEREGTPEKIIIDNFDQSGMGLLNRMKQLDPSIEKIKTEWIIENYADEKYGEVMLAGMVAKYVYDRHINTLHKKYGLGSGQPNDFRTLKFLYEHHSHYNLIECEGCKYIRASWVTFERLNNAFQKEALRKKLEEVGLIESS